jgi:protein-L-isoaspartate O-methyltransferase
MQQHKATYSPEDNKLRLYPAMRLSKEDYERVKAHGFSWAPKQELFVAPAWSPEREDLLLEFAEEIEDEDTTLVERAEQRAERFEDYSEARMEDAEAARRAVGSIADNIPLGQPILVGHHSEKHARRDAERIENGMRRAVKMWETSKYWEQRAQGSIRAAKYKELPAVRARRIKGIEADKRKRERAKDEAERLVRFWGGKLFAKNPTTGEKRPIEIKNENREWLCNLLGQMPSCGVQIRGIDGQHWYSAWDILRPDEERYKNCPVKTVEELRDAALRVQSALIARCDRWLAHYSNRLAYEMAMLAADGGTEADKNKPEKGGACRCWASPSGGWSYIQKVNKVSVTVLDNWGNGGPNFTRVIPFDKLTEVMTAEEVETSRDLGRIVESRDKIGFFFTSNTPSESPTHFRENWAQRAHEAAVAGRTEENKRNAEFQALKHAAKAGVQVVTANQLFPTPPELAKRLVELADIQPGNRVLEPSAGTGNLLRAMPEHCESVAIEIDPKLSSRLRAFDEAYPHLVSVWVGKDFLECTGEFLGMFDRIVMNPPFERGSDIKHIKHAMGFLRPGGKLVAICAAGPRQRDELSTLGEWIDLPDGSFKEQGTNVSTAIVVIEN